MKDLTSNSKKMLEYIIDIYCNDIGYEYGWPIESAKNLIEEVTGKNIDDALKDFFEGDSDEKRIRD